MKKVILIGVVVVIVVFAGVIAWVKYSSPQPIACTMEAKLCADGSALGRTGPNCEFPACPKEDLIRIFSHLPNTEIQSPLLIKGEARGTWFFEASFPIHLYDADGKEIAVAIAQAKDNWMTEDFIPFEATLTFQAPKTSGGTLVFEKDNPSGLPENSDELRVPVRFGGSEARTRAVKLFYYNSDKDKDPSGNIKCSRDGLVAVPREIPFTNTPVQDVVTLLLKGKENLTQSEFAQGISTEYPLEGFSLKGALLRDGVLTLEFNDFQNKTVGGSCRVGILWFQIETTVKQFPEVKEVRFIPEELFQP